MTKRPLLLPRLLLALLAAALCLVPGAVVDPRPAHAAKPPSIALGSITPKAPTAKSKVRLTGTVSNPGKQEFSDVSVRLRISRTAMSSRELVNQYATTQQGSTGTPIYGRQDDVGDLTAGSDQAFDLTVPAADLQLRSFGVYPIAIEAFLPDGTQLAVQRTFLVYTPDEKSVPKPTKVGWLLPLVDRPHQELGGTFTDDDLTQAMGPDGRLTKLVRAGKAAAAADVPVTWAIDPALLDAAKHMTQGYRVRSGNRLAAGRGKAAATVFLAELKAATAHQSVLALPYADVDTVALARADLSTDLTTALTQGEDIVNEVLGAEPTTTLTWPPDGQIDQQGLNALASNRMRTAVLQDTALPLSETLDYTPDPVAMTRTSSGSVKALLADSRLTEIVGGGGTTDPANAALTEQRFLAETALITAERPSLSRGLVVAPPRGWDPPDDLAANLLGDSGGAPWLEPTSLSDLAGAKPVKDLNRRKLTYTDEARKAELTGSHLAKVRKLHTSLERFSAIFNPLPDSIKDYNLAVLRAESTGWRSDRRGGRAFLASLTKAVAQQRGKVRILPNTRPLSMASEEGMIPVTIENDLDEPVTVRLSVTSTNERRMTVGKVPASTTIGARQKATVQVPLHANASGVIELRAQLRTPQDDAYAKATAFDVRSTAVGTVAVVITASALVVLFAGAGYRVARRVLKARRQHRTDQAAG